MTTTQKDNDGGDTTNLNVETIGINHTKNSEVTTTTKEKTTTTIGETATTIGETTTTIGETTESNIIGEGTTTQSNKETNQETETKDPGTVTPIQPTNRDQDRTSIERSKTCPKNRT